MKKVTYEQPNLQVQLLAVEDVVRTSGNVIFEGYTSENWQ